MCLTFSCRGRWVSSFSTMCGHALSITSRRHTALSCTQNTHVSIQFSCLNAANKDISKQNDSSSSVYPLVEHCEVFETMTSVHSFFFSPRFNGTHNPSSWIGFPTNMYVSVHVCECMCVWCVVCVCVFVCVCVCM